MATEGLGRSRGGVTTTVHAVVDALGNCLSRKLSPGEQADCSALPDLLAALPEKPGAVADKAHDTNAVLAAIVQHQAEAVIPPKANRCEQRAYDENLYADRNTAEQLFGRLREARAFAIRYEKTATSFLVVAHLLAALDWLR